MPKVQYATEGDLETAKKELQDALGSNKSACDKSIKDCESKLKGEIGKVDGAVKNAATKLQETSDRLSTDLKLYADQTAEAAKQEIGQQFPVMEDRIKGCEDSLTALIEKVNADLRAALAEEIASLCSHFDKELATMKAELTTQDEKWAKEANEALMEQRRQIDAKIQEERQGSEGRDQDLKQAAQKESERLDTCIAERKSEHDQLAEKLRQIEQDLSQKLDKLGGHLNDHQEATRAQGNKLRQGASDDLAEFRKEADSRMQQINDEADALRNAVAEVENLSTRRVDWVIRNASQVLQPPPASKSALLAGSWFSPKFNAAGAHGLQLELQVFRKSDPPAEADNWGDCAVFLWACKGMNLIFRLSVGNKTVHLERIFNGKVPYGSKRLTFVNKHINKEDDTLRVSVEILECIREVVSPPSVGPSPIEVKDKGLEDEDEATPKIQPAEGSIVVKRHVNHRLHDQVKSQVEVMRSRMVRRVEWRLEQAAVLPKRFPAGEALCSPQFAAAGIEGFQLLFYPCGYKGASDGYCSLFLFAPAGTTLRCALYLGSQRRDIQHTFDAHGAFGRTNYCKFDAAVDEDNCILVGMEVEEAMQEVQKAAAHAMVQPGDRRTQAEIDGLPSSDSVVKLQRTFDKPAKGLEDKRVLPSLWTTQSAGDRMHGFNELKTKNPGISPRVEPPSPAHAARMGQRSGSLPALPQERSTDSVAMSVAHFSKSSVGEACLGDSLPRKARNSGRRGPAGGRMQAAS